MGGGEMGGGLLDDDDDDDDERESCSSHLTYTARGFMSDSEESGESGV